MEAQAVPSLQWNQPKAREKNKKNMAYLNYVQWQAGMCLQAAGGALHKFFAAGAFDQVVSRTASIAGPNSTKGEEFVQKSFRARHPPFHIVLEIVIS